MHEDAFTKQTYIGSCKWVETMQNIYKMLLPHVKRHILHYVLQHDTLNCLIDTDKSNSDWHHNSTYLLTNRSSHVGMNFGV